MTRLIDATGLRAGFDGTDILSGVDFHVDAGEIVTVVGPNGSGKSTLMRLLVGAMTPRAGRITRKPGLRLGYVPQRLSIDPTLPLSVSRFLDLPRPVPRDDKQRVMERVGITGLADLPLNGLSGGQYQRALLSRALLTRPDLLILDEATQGMDQRGSADFYALIADLRAEFGTAVLMVSHELHVVMSASDRVVCLNGHVCCEGTPEIVRSAPEYRALFGTGTHGALALYRHEHDHSHDHAAAHDHDHAGTHALGRQHGHAHGHAHGLTHGDAGPSHDHPAPARHATHDAARDHRHGPGDADNHDRAASADARDHWTQGNAASVSSAPGNTAPQAALRSTRTSGDGPAEEVTAVTGAAKGRAVGSGAAGRGAAGSAIVGGGAAESAAVERSTAKDPAGRTATDDPRPGRQEAET